MGDRLLHLPDAPRGVRPLHARGRSGRHRINRRRKARLAGHASLLWLRRHDGISFLRGAVHSERSEESLRPIGPCVGHEFFSAALTLTWPADFRYTGAR